MIIVKKFDSTGREIGVSPRAEAIVAVMRHDPAKVPAMLSELGFSRVSDIPYSEKERIEGVAARDFPRMIQSGIIFKIDNVARDNKRPPLVKEGNKSHKNNLLQTQSWIKSKNWKTTQLLEIFDYLAQARRLEVRYSVDRAGNEKSLTGAVRFEADLTEQKAKSSTSFILFVEGKKVAHFDDLSSFSLTKLE